MATWIAPQTFVDGDRLSFAELGAAAGADGDLQWLKDALARIGITASTGNQSISSALRGTRVFGTSQAIPDSTWTTLAWSDQRFGTSSGSDHNFRTELRPDVLYLPAVPDNLLFWGWWMMGAHATFEPNATGTRGIRISIADSYLANFTTTVLASKLTAAAASGETALSITTLDGGASTFGSDNQLVSRSIMTVEVYQTSGGKLNISASPAGSPEFWIFHAGKSS